MSTYTGPSSGRGRGPLTRRDVEKRLQEVGGSEDLKLVGEDLSRSNLSGLILRKADLTDAKLTGANLSGANLSGAKLTGADLSGASLKDAKLIGANLSGAGLSGAYLAGANFSGADLSGAYLRVTNLTGANLSGASLKDAKLTGANLSGAKLTNANLNYADLNYTDLSGAGLTGADLSGAYLNEAYLSRANLSGAKLTGTDLSGASLTSTNFSGADLSGAALRVTNLMGANLSGAKLTNANLTSADLSGANLSGAKLTNADLTGADLNRTDLTEIFISSTKFSLDPELLGRLAITLRKESEKEREVSPFLRLRIQEEPLTAQHLSATLNTFTSLYTKMWLLQQGRFEDFVRYTEHKDHRFEEEANLLIAELKYNSPADIKFHIDLSPKTLIEALQTLIDMITQIKLRKQLKEEEVIKERLNNVEHMLIIIMKLYPDLNKEQKDVVLQSLMKDVLRLAEDQTLEISLQLPPIVPQQPNSQVGLQEQESSVQTSEKTA